MGAILSCGCDVSANALTLCEKCYKKYVACGVVRHERNNILKNNPFELEKIREQIMRGNIK